MIVFVSVEQTRTFHLKHALLFYAIFFGLSIRKIKNLSIHNIEKSEENSKRKRKASGGRYDREI